MNRGSALDPSSVAWGADGLIAAVVQDATDGDVLMLGWQDAEALAATLTTGDVHFHSRSRGRLWRKGETSGNVLRLVDAALDCDADAILLRVDPAGPTCHTGTRSCFDAHGDATANGDATGNGDRTAMGDRTPMGTGTASETAKGDATATDEGSATDDSRSTAQLPASQGFVWLEILWATIAARNRERPQGSYTAKLLDGGVDAVARKVAEEAIEVVLAAKDDETAAVDGGATRNQTALAGELADLVFHTLVLLAERGLTPSEVIAVLQARHAPAVTDSRIR